MTNLKKAMLYMDKIGMDYDVVGGKMFIEAWNREHTEAYTFQVAQEEVDTMADYYDERNKSKEVTQ